MPLFLANVHACSCLYDVKCSFHENLSVCTSWEMFNLLALEYGSTSIAQNTHVFLNCFYFLNFFGSAFLWLLLLVLSAFGCPYSDINMKKEVVLPDRLGGEKQITFVPVHFVQKTKRLCAEQEEEEEVNDKDSHEENRLG